MSKLALKGGNPVRVKQFPAWPQYDNKEQERIIKVLHSGVWGTLGEEVNKFSIRFAAYQGCKYGISVTNGTVTLEVILRALGIGAGDEVIIPSYTFNATCSAVLFVGAKPVFADIDLDTFNIKLDAIEGLITSNTKAIIPVHMAGRSCDMDIIMAIASKHNLYVIEDSAHAHGSEWKNKRVGSIGDAGSFSFQASKNLTAGEGGAITTNNKELYERAWSIHHCGRDINGGAWYSHPMIGTNARLTEWQAAILDSQLDRLDGQIDTRMMNAEYLDSQLSQIGPFKTLVKDDRVTRNSYHLYIFRYLEELAKGVSRDKFIEALSAEGIPCMSGYKCLYSQELLRSPEIKKILGSDSLYNNVNNPNCEIATAKQAIWFKHSMLLGTREDMDSIVEAVVKVYNNLDELV